ncbi:hypothetical protein J4Q44_G00227170 [Coregonus suidteri]|uniref:Uncharacterized protein n=1 Tax=Coregonus suidteri TaxID=861788 RepID=A0AAN8LAC3_9TELE
MVTPGLDEWTNGTALDKALDSCRTRSERLHAWAEKDVEVRLNMDKSQEKQKESHQRRIKGNKCFDIRANDFAWKKDERRRDLGNLAALSLLAGGPSLTSLINPTDIKHLTGPRGSA